jgi:hypothetical protein
MISRWYESGVAPFTGARIETVSHCHMPGAHPQHPRSGRHIPMVALRPSTMPQAGAARPLP